MTLPTETVKDLTKAARKGDWGTVMSGTLTLRNFTFAVTAGGLDITQVPTRTRTAFKKAAEAATDAVSAARPKGPSKRSVAGGKLTTGQAAGAAIQELDIVTSLVG
jgi:hypothetical protein